MSKTIIVAVDETQLGNFQNVVDSLDSDLCMIKVGSVSFNALGHQAISYASNKGFKIFLDLKLHDIPNTVYQAIKSAADQGVWMVNVHASGGSKMLEASYKALSGYPNPPLLIGVTVLTSVSEESLKEVGLSHLQEQVLKLAGLAKDNGLDGVVCAASDISSIKSKFGEDFLTVTPGIRPAQSNLNDQNRVSTPLEAIKNGSDYLVIGLSLIHI